uniref:Uncharacterized protein n=1 Tax=Rhizophora mucronata TaxID=61149 RepID=A0A2P2PAK8_RHIMU
MQEDCIKFQNDLISRTSNEKGSFIQHAMLMRLKELLIFHS